MFVEDVHEMNVSFVKNYFTLYVSDWTAFSHPDVLTVSYRQNIWVRKSGPIAGVICYTKPLWSYDYDCNDSWLLLSLLLCLPFYITSKVMPARFSKDQTNQATCVVFS